MEKLSRREFQKASGAFALTLAAGSEIFLTGCPEAQVMADISHWAPVGKAAFDSLAGILISAGVIPAAFAAKAIIDDLFDQLTADANAYLAITPPPSGALAQVEATFTVILTNLQNFLSGLGLSSGSLLNVIVNLAEIIFSTIAGFQGDLPASATALKTTLKNLEGAPLRVGQTRTFTVVAKHRTIRAFKKDYNAEAKASGYPQAQLKLSFFEHF